MSNSLVEVVIPDDGYQELKRSLEKHKRCLISYKENLKQREAQLIQYKDSEDTLRIVENYIRDEESNIEEVKRRLRNTEVKIKNYKRTSNLIRLSDIKKTLEHHTNITNISLKQRDDGEIFIEYVYHNVKCTPNYSPYLNLRDSSFDLLPVKARIFLSCNKVYLLPLYEDEDKTTKGYDGRYVIHPHILSTNGHPCLGDFNSSFFNAMSDDDLDTAVTILELFLEQADTKDDAGQYWPRFMLHNLVLDYCRYGTKSLEDQDGRTYCYYGRHRVIDRRYWYTIPIVEGGRVTMLEGRKEDVLKFLKNYINI